MRARVALAVIGICATAPAEAVVLQMKIAAKSWYPFLTEVPAPFDGGGGVVIFDQPKNFGVVTPRSSTLTLNGKLWTAGELTVEYREYPDGGTYIIQDVWRYPYDGNFVQVVHAFPNGRPYIHMSAPTLSGIYIAVSDEARITLSAVPEPFTWAMMALGFGIVGCAARRGRAIRLTTDV